MRETVDERDQRWSHDEASTRAKCGDPAGVKSLKIPESRSFQDKQGKPSKRKSNRVMEKSATTARQNSAKSIMHNKKKEVQVLLVLSVFASRVNTTHHPLSHATHTPILVP
jgi:hypothetical protein